MSAAFEDSLRPTGVRASAACQTAWLEIPASLLAGRTYAMVGGDVRRADGSGHVYRTAWRTVAL